MQEYTFETPEPVELFAEIGSGEIAVTADEVATTQVRIEGSDADDVMVTQKGRTISIVGPKQRGVFGRSHSITATVTVPTGSDLATKTGSADISAEGRFGQAQIQSGSGQVEGGTFTGDVVVNTGSGEVTLKEVLGDLRIKSGSGDVEVDRVAASCSISTGSGDIELGSVGEAASLKTGSGDTTIKEAGADTSLTTGSGDLDVQALRAGALKVKAASGDVEVAIPSGTPVWTEVSTLSGDVDNDLPSAGQPAEGEPFVELRVTTVSGDIHLRQL
ncbi:DUF4097 family beta strand repeat-containing protein [Luteipulveratus mongoliensis]|uniref:DUF4097 domain-containing protein n=1 Tax=Luteipulveratus mongoliensis TaxID=571913 RepID=A0A0K1JMB0_9MICO|nr:DUF4097 family beta strand repeat-containing protein [Luteipulveratus mongoliensis]AKU17857.1 hypothetical protein VV02_21665 [Luteipulveratus mongoliensis]